MSFSAGLRKQQKIWRKIDSVLFSWYPITMQNIITKKEYQHLVKRQEKIEEELNVMKRILWIESDEEKIRPAVLKRWEKISRDMDRGKGRVFTSVSEMKKWLENL